MSEGISIELGSLANYLEDRTRRMFGKDADTLDWLNRLQRRGKIGLEQAGWVQCVGMEKPIRIDQIYQPIDLEGNYDGAVSNTRGRTNVFTLLKQEKDAVIFAGPGRGKTTLLNWLLLTLLRANENTPLLFLLRTEKAVEDLSELVQRLATGQKTGIPRGDRIILLVDGYDEIDEIQRKAVSDALAQFRSLGIGNFCLTCRTFYDVYELKVSHYRLSAFSYDDSFKFVSAFADCYGCDIDAKRLLETLKSRGLWDFATHPLMLTLICMLKTSTLPELPQNSLHLLKRAFDTLTFRWDEQKGVRRKSRLAVDGEDRVSCLMRIAYQMNGLISTQEQVEAYARYFLKLLQRKIHIDPRQLLQEIAQWYGVLVPADGDKWQFAHRSIHDYLAARFLTEIGNFDPSKERVSNSRAAYAVCLSHDGTKGMKLALERTRDLHAFTECLYNKVPFDAAEVSQSVLTHFRKYRPFIHQQSGRWLTVETDQDFCSLASDKLLMELIATALRTYPRGRDSSETLAGTGHDVVLALAFAELKKRKAKIKDMDMQHMAESVFESLEHVFQIGIEVPFIIRLHEVFEHPGWRVVPS